MLKRNFTMLMLCMTLCVIICNMLYVNSYAETGREYIYNNETGKHSGGWWGIEEKLDADIEGMKNLTEKVVFTVKKYPQNDSWSFFSSPVEVEDGTAKRMFSCIWNKSGEIRSPDTSVLYFKPELNKKYTMLCVADCVENICKLRFFDEDGNPVTETISIDVKTDGQKILKLIQVRMYAEQGSDMELHSFQIYDGSLKIVDSSIKNGDENIRNDEKPFLIFSDVVDKESLSEITIKNEDGEQIPIDIALDEDNANRVNIDSLRGFEYNKKYTLNISEKLMSALGMTAKSEEISFVVEKPPFELKMKANIEHNNINVNIQEKNISPYDRQENYIILGYNLDGLLVFAQKECLVLPQNTEESKTVQIPVAGGHEISSVKAVLLPDLSGENYTNTHENVLFIENGILDRPFEENRHVYNILSKSDTLIKFRDGELIDENNGVKTYKYNNDTYKIIVNELADKIDFDVEFTNDKTVRIDFTKPLDDDTYVIITKPISMGSEEFYSFDDIKEFVSQERICDAVIVEKGNKDVEYAFADGAISGMYGICVLNERTMQESTANIYYSSKYDLDRALERVLEIKTKSDNKKKELDEFICEYANILKLNLEEYHLLNDKNIIFDSIINTEFDSLEKFVNIYNEAYAVSVYNESENRIDALNRYREIFNIKEDNLSLVKNKKNLNALLKKDVCVDKEGVINSVNSNVALTLVNESQPLTIIKIIEDNSFVLGISDENISKLNALNDKSAVINDMTEKNFSDLQSFNKALSEALEKKPDKIDSDSPKGHNSSKTSIKGNGSNSDSKGSFLPATATKPQKQQEQEENNTTGETKDELFTDIYSVEWAREAIENLAKSGIVNGKGNRIFKPNDYVTREEFLKMLILSLKISHDSETGKIFSDVSDEMWYATYVKIGYELGIAKGIGNGEFGIGKNITRQDMAAMMYNAIKAMSIELTDTGTPKSFADIGEVSEYALDAVNVLCKSGIINGVDSDNFNPHGIATRAQAAQVIYNLLSVLNKEAVQ